MSEVTERHEPRRVPQSPPGGAGAVYGLGMVGALVYYWRHASGVGGHAAAVGRAVVWPVFLVYGVLDHLGRR